MRLNVILLTTKVNDHNFFSIHSSRLQTDKMKFPLEDLTSSRAVICSELPTTIRPSALSSLSSLFNDYYFLRVFFRKYCQFRAEHQCDFDSKITKLVIIFLRPEPLSSFAYIFTFFNVSMIISSLSPKDTFNNSIG